MVIGCMVGLLVRLKVISQLLKKRYYSGVHYFSQIFFLAKTQGTQSYKPARFKKIINDFFANLQVIKYSGYLIFNQSDIKISELSFSSVPHCVRRLSQRMRDDFAR